MLNFIQSIVQPVAVEALVLLFGLLLTFALRNMPEAIRRIVENQFLGSEEKRRQALHSAAQTAVGLIFSTARASGEVRSIDAMVTEAARYVYASVPDAIKELAPTPAVVRDMIRSKLAAEVNKLLGVDPLADALKAAMEQS